LGNSEEVATWLPMLRNLKINKVHPDLLLIIARAVENGKLVEFQTDEWYFTDKKVDTLLQEFLLTGNIMESSSGNTYREAIGKIIRGNTQTLKKVSEFRYEEGNELSFRTNELSLNTKLEKVNLKIYPYNDDFELNAIFNWLRSLENQKALTELSLCLIDPKPKDTRVPRMSIIDTAYDLVMQLIKNNTQSLTKLELELFGWRSLSRAWENGLAELLSSCVTLKYLVFNFSPDPFEDKGVGYSVPPGFRGQ